jgi:hypothetical protein
MKKIEFTTEELQLLRRIFAFVSDESYWRKPPASEIFSCTILIYEIELNMDVLNSIDNKLYV